MRAAKLATWILLLTLLAGCRTVTAPVIEKPAAEIEKQLRVDLEPLFSFGGQGRGPGQLSFPQGVAVGDDGLIYVSDTNNYRVQVFDRDGHYLRQWGSIGPEDGEFSSTLGIAVQGGRAYVCDSHGRVQAFDTNGNFLWKWEEFGDDVAVDARGRVFVLAVVDGGPFGQYVIRVLDPNGRLLDTWGRGVLGPATSIAVDRKGTLWVAEVESGTISTFDHKGKLHRRFTAPGGASGIAVDDAGVIYLTTYSGAPERLSAVDAYDHKGRLLAKAFPFDPSSMLAQGWHLDVSSDSDGRVYVTDVFSHQIRVLGINVGHGHGGDEIAELQAKGPR